ncbi:unnamed protein product [Schistosoma spindalis]|nr:unnamed protein product [Schistosoma spindale]
MKLVFIILFILYYIIKEHFHCSSITPLCSLDSNQINIIHSYIILNKTEYFCKANQLCADYGKKTNQISYLIGQNYKNAMKCFPNHSFWTKINQINFLLLKNNNLSNYWIDGLSRSYLMNELESNLPSFYENKSLSNGKYIAFYNHLDDKLQTTLTNRTNEIDVVCEIEQNVINNKISNNQNDNHFIQLKQFQKCSNVNTEELLSPHEDFDGCYSQNRESNLQYCAYSCVKDEYCTRFYYNNITNDCIVTQYIVSLIPSYHPHKGKEWDCYSLNVDN